MSADRTSESDGIQVPEQVIDEMSELLCRFQQMNTSDDSRLNRIRQGILLSSELIDVIERTTPTGMNIVQDCFQLLQKEFLVFQSTTEMQDEKLFVREIFFPLLDLLSKPQICMYLNDNSQTPMEQREFYKNLTSLLVTSASATSRYVPLFKDDVVSCKYTDILCAMYTRVKCYLQSGSHRIEQPTDYDHQAIDDILLFLWNLTDRTIVVRWILDTGFTESMLECLTIADSPSKATRKLIGIVHNISRHDDGVDELKKLDGLSIIKDFQSRHADTCVNEPNLVASMAIALLSTPEEIRSDNKRMNKILNQLLQMTMKATEDEYYRVEGFHVSEPLAVFTKLFVDDHSLEYILNHAETEPQLNVSSTIALFIKLLIEFQNAPSDVKQLQQFTCIALLNILWSISFQQRYKTKLQQNEDLLEAIRSFAIDDAKTVTDQYIPRSMESTTKSANGILFNLNQIPNSKNSIIPNAHSISNTSTGKPMIMISYAHDNNLFCDKILEEFEKYQDIFDIWVDRNHCTSSEDLWEKIARAIKQSNLVICLLSQDYFNSKSCRKEASFAIQRRKTIIPVYIDEPGDCDWLDIHIAGLKYVRFKNYTNGLDRSKVQELLTTIQATIQETQVHPFQQPQQQQTKEHVVPTSSRKRTIVFDMKKPPEEWTTDEIRHWFDSHKVPETLVKLFDFQSFIEMHNYSEKLLADPEREYAKYEQQYAKYHGGDELEEYKFNRFKTALLTVTNNPFQVVQTSTRSRRISTVKCNTCSTL